MTNTDRIQMTEFLNECFILHRNKRTDHKIKTSAIHYDYREWIDRSPQYREIGARQFILLLNEVGPQLGIRRNSRREWLDLERRGAADSTFSSWLWQQRERTDQVGYLATLWNRWGQNVYTTPGNLFDGERTNLDPSTCLYLLAAANEWADQHRMGRGFSQWLAQQVDRDDTVGDLARDWAARGSRGYATHNEFRKGELGEASAEAITAWTLATALWRDER